MITLTLIHNGYFLESKTRALVTQDLGRSWLVCGSFQLQHSNCVFVFSFSSPNINSSILVLHFRSIQQLSVCHLLPREQLLLNQIENIFMGLKGCLWMLSFIYPFIGQSIHLPVNERGIKQYFKLTLKCNFYFMKMSCS